ncbi:DUF2163 domain-containing protein [Aestuariibius sp. 2305UL40-4]|uniref:DUF2163 domain-containing protein n=1 Tax=Aestuariibius violaceus TaxID=3234132 RepID=UPI00345E580B
MSTLIEHLQTGTTSVARCWSVSRADGMVHGFTDHDRDIVFDSITFSADSGLTASALSQTTGLSVDNSEAMGVLSSAAISDTDIEAGRCDGAEIKAWLVNWADTDQRELQFRGTVGEIRRSGGAFTVELRGLAEKLNEPRGRVFQPGCSAVLGDTSCEADLTINGFFTEQGVRADGDGEVFRFPGLLEFEERWFERGTLMMLDGAAQGLSEVVKHDRVIDGVRVVELWAPLRAEVKEGDRLTITAGCDKRVETCKFKFDNFLNFRGFPDIPGEDWLISTPDRGGKHDGGSRTR